MTDQETAGRKSTTTCLVKISQMFAVIAASGLHREYRFQKTIHLLRLRHFRGQPRISGTDTTVREDGATLTETDSEAWGVSLSFSTDGLSSEWIEVEGPHLSGTHTECPITIASNCQEIMSMHMERADSEGTHKGVEGEEEYEIIDGDEVVTQEDVMMNDYAVVEWEDLVAGEIPDEAEL
jgi:hypothetical protein